MRFNLIKYKGEFLSFHDYMEFFRNDFARSINSKYPPLMLGDWINDNLVNVNFWLSFGLDLK